MKVKVITDSASNMGIELLNEYGIDMVSLSFEEDGVVHPCYDPSRSYEEQGKEFYDKLRNGVRFKTSLVSPSEYYDIFKKYLDQGYDIFYTSISSKLSGTLNSALNAKMMLEDDYPDRKIACIDSMSASFGEAIIAMEAAKLAKEDASLDEIVAKIEPIRLNVRNEFTVDNLNYLKTGGRIQSLLYRTVNILDIKPLLRASKEATIEMCGVVKGRKRSLRKIAETVKDTIENPESQTIYIAHCDCREDAELVEKSIREMVDNVGKIVISMYDFCTGAHVGPGAMAVFYFGKTRK